MPETDFSGKAIINYKAHINDQVFFAVYQKAGLEFANFVEPYFESLQDLDRLR